MTYNREDVWGPREGYEHISYLMDYNGEFRRQTLRSSEEEEENERLLKSYHSSIPNKRKFTKSTAYITNGLKKDPLKEALSPLHGYKCGNQLTRQSRTFTDLGGAPLDEKIYDVEEREGSPTQRYVYQIPTEVEYPLQKRIYELADKVGLLKGKRISYKRGRTDDVVESQREIKALKSRESTIDTETTDDTCYSLERNQPDGWITNEIDPESYLVENPKYGGPFIWKVDRIALRIFEAKSGRQLSLHSTPAYTSKYGYKFCVRLFLNGDVCGKRTHISLFFVLMKSPNDNMLLWPFNKQVSIYVINQEDRGRDEVARFVPNVKSSCWRRPRKEMNRPVGRRKFLTQKRFLHDGFIKDDSAFVQVTISDVNSY